MSASFQIPLIDRQYLTFNRGHDPSRIFHKRVNRRNVPDYYEVIKEPMAFSNLKQKTAEREYKSFAEFIRDCALIWHNAHTYNRPDAGAYQDASVLKDLMEEGFRRLAEKKLVKEDDIKWPDLGEIPPVEDIPEEAEEDEEEEDEDEDEDDDDSGEEKPKKRRGPGRRPRRDTMLSDKGDTGKKRRGRPPKVDTPMEARIKNVLKGLRKLRNDDGLMIYNFEKLPERSAMPEYYEYIKKPMSIDQIKVWSVLLTDFLY
jgi:chromatin structure-remodeling complex subunit RSC1/2